MSISITLAKPALEKLKKLKERRESFSAMITRELPDRLSTRGEVMDYFQKHGLPNANPKPETRMFSGRGRRSNRN